MQRVLDADVILERERAAREREAEAERGRRDPPNRAPIEPVENRAAAHALPLMAEAMEELHQRRFSPRRNRWKEVAEFDRRVRELGERQTTLNDELGALEERHKESERADREALATWAANGKGKRPEPTAPAVRQRIEELTQNREALSLAVTPCPGRQS